MNKKDQHINSNSAEKFRMSTYRAIDKNKALV